jgi:hypothetical protein
MGDFFVSYTKADRAWAEWIAWQLEEAGYIVTLQAWDFRPGQNFALRMNDAAEHSGRTLIVLSPDFLSSPFAASEWAEAFARDPTGQSGSLLPVRVHPYQPTGLLRALVYVDLVGLDEEGARKALLEGASPGRAKPSTPPSFPEQPAPHSVAAPERFPGHDRRDRPRRRRAVVATAVAAGAAVVAVGGWVVSSRLPTGGSTLPSSPEPWNARDLPSAFLVIDGQLRTYVDRARDLKDAFAYANPEAFSDGNTHERINKAVHAYNAIREQVEKDRPQYRFAVERYTSKRSSIPSHVDALLEQISAFHQSHVLPLNDVSKVADRLVTQTGADADLERARQAASLTARLRVMNADLDTIAESLRSLEREVEKKL